MSLNLLDIAALCNYDPLEPVSKIKTWAISLIYAQFNSVTNIKGYKIPKEALWNEMHEAIYEHLMGKPRSKNDFLFWAWQSKQYEGSNYDHDWFLRYAMMEYHTKLALNTERVYTLLK